MKKTMNEFWLASLVDKWSLLGEEQYLWSPCKAKGGDGFLWFPLVMWVEDYVLGFLDREPLKPLFIVIGSGFL